MEVKYSIQNYDWGKIGLNSKVAQLLKSKGEIIDESKPYAELWLGTHPSGPSYLLLEDDVLENLESWIQKSPNSLGKITSLNFNGKLPYLMKVLSVNKALSIQMHPSKEQAASLHKKYPNLYKDDNHKPELAIALSKFEALCGFKELNQIRNNIKNTREIQIVIGDELVNEMLNCNEENSIEVFKKVFHTLMNSSENIVEEQLSILSTRIKGSTDQTEEMKVFCRVYKQFPGDCGCFCVFLFNYVCLEPGESIFIGANEPHAYLEGDCIECMACSDNVVRAGLTPKFKDIPTLCTLLNYHFESANAKLLLPIIENDSSQSYLPPGITDFAVSKIEVQPKTEYNLIVRQSASMCLCIQGHGKLNNNTVNGKLNINSTVIHSGKAFFLPANENISILNTDENIVLEMYQTFTNVDL